MGGFVYTWAIGTCYRLSAPITLAVSTHLCSLPCLDTTRDIHKATSDLPAGLELGP